MERWLIINLIVFTIFLPGLAVFAQTDYQLLEPSVVPGLSSINADNFGVYLKNLYLAILTATITLSVLIFTIGGFQHILSQVPYLKIEGTEKMINALWGLGIALASYLILNTINPDLVSLKTLAQILNGAGN